MILEEQQPASSAPKASPLSGRQRALYEALAARDSKLGDMYIGAMAVLAQHDNPDRYALASHGLRELLKTMPKHLDLPIPTEPPPLGDKVRVLAGVWERVVNHPTWKGNDGWNGSIDEILRSFLKRAREFFDWHGANRPMRRDRRTRILRGLDPSRGPLPPVIEDLHVEEWLRYENYFTKVAHHGIVPTTEEFDAWLGGVEGFLVDRLRPRTFEDFQVIDRLIKEGEGSA